MCERRTKNPNHILKQQKTQINAIDMLPDTCLKQLKEDDRILFFLRKYWDAYFLTCQPKMVWKWVFSGNAFIYENEIYQIFPKMQLLIALFTEKNILKNVWTLYWKARNSRMSWKLLEKIQYDWRIYQPALAPLLIIYLSILKVLPCEYFFFLHMNFAWSGLDFAFLQFKDLLLK